MGEGPAIVRAGRRRVRYLAYIAAAAVMGVGAAAGATAAGASTARTLAVNSVSGYGGPATATPIKHLVVLFDENISFDHYFGTYPFATNADGSPFHAKPGTPIVNGLSGPLLTHNPNVANPQRLGPAQALTCDQNHAYKAEQQAFDQGLMDKFVQFTAGGSCTDKNIVLDYYDGNTVTALWNYAQRFALNDNSFSNGFGPSTPGALNVTSGQTFGGAGVNAAGQVVPDPGVVGSPNASGVGTVYSDQDPYYDDCSSGAIKLKMSGTNIGDLLTGNNISWGWFEGGFAPSSTTSTGAAVCAASHMNIGGTSVTDYIPHHEPFQYYASTANPHHLAPKNLAEVGHNGQANHQYDLSWFYKAVSGGNLPAVSYVKAAAYQDGHAGYSDPLDEQNFLVTAVNAIERSQYWHNTAIVILYDDSDGWYDHQMSPILNPSADPATDALNGPGMCGNGTPLGGYQDRCGFGPRQPLLVVSPYAKSNFVDGTLSSQASIVTFIEDNWLGSARIGGGSWDAVGGTVDNMFNFRNPKFKPLILDPTTGEPV